jgi:hypothetical protein
MNIMEFLGDISTNGLKDDVMRRECFFLLRPILGRQGWSLRARTDGLALAHNE